MDARKESKQRDRMRLGQGETGDLCGEASEDPQDNKDNKYTTIINSLAFKNLGEVQSRQGEQPVPRPCGRNELGMLRNRGEGSSHITNKDICRK